MVTGLWGIGGEEGNGGKEKRRGLGKGEREGEGGDRVRCQLKRLKG